MSTGSPDLQGVHERYSTRLVEELSSASGREHTYDISDPTLVLKKAAGFQVITVKRVFCCIQDSLWMLGIFVIFLHWWVLI